MQLPPTILSLDHKKKKEEKPAPRSKVAKEAESSQTRGSDENSDSETSSNEDSCMPDGVAQMSISSERVVLIPPRTLETTLFDRLEKMYGTRIKKMLEIQYR